MPTVSFCVYVRLTLKSRRINSPLHLVQGDAGFLQARQSWPRCPAQTDCGTVQADPSLLSMWRVQWQRQASSSKLKQFATVLALRETVVPGSYAHM